MTKDLTCLQIEEPDAEKMKLKYAKAYTDINNIDPTLNYPTGADGRKAVSASGACYP